MAEGQLKRNKQLQGLLINKDRGNHKALVVVGHTVGFERANEKDPKEQWTKLYLPDKEGNLNAAFVLLNDITRKAIKQPPEAGLPVSVVDFTPTPHGIVDHSLLWTDRQTGLGSDFTTIHEYDNNHLVLDAQSDELVIVNNSNGGDKQLWKFKLNANA